MPYIAPALSSGQSGEDGQERMGQNMPFSNLPAQLTSFIGREQEVKAVCTLLRRPDVHLLTITGVGGIGKTRLGLQVATELIPQFTDGVCFVNLASLSDANLVFSMIAQALGLSDAGDRPLLEYLQAHLQDKDMLLLLDNFEQVAAAAVQLTAVLMHCPALKILLTSRAVLRVHGEHEFSVPPLALPDLKHLPEDATLLQYPAIALFLQRAQAIKPDFQVSRASIQIIAEICIHLDGLPLAIELAAARVRLLPLHALRQRLTHRMRLLTGGPRDGSVRQQTLRNTLMWSYNLLDSAEQRLFRRFSVFAGGCTLEAVEAIYTVLDGETTEVLELMASLLDKSLLQRSEQSGNDGRFYMLETIREYGLECLLTSGEMAAVRQAHAGYYMWRDDHLTSPPGTRGLFSGGCCTSAGLVGREPTQVEGDRL